jgi:hypothetical protein
VVEQQLSAKESAGAAAGGVSLPPIPPDALIIVPVRNTVLFPGLVLPITLGRPKSIGAAQQAVRDQRQVGILLQRAAEVEDPTAIDMHRMGTQSSPGLPGRAALSDRRISFRLAVSGSAGLAHSGAGDAFARDRSALRQSQSASRGSGFAVAAGAG